MTKEELKQEAKVYSYKLYHSKAWNPGEDMLVKAYLAGAEPREKQITGLSKHILELQKDKGNLTDKVRELEAQNNWLEGCKLELDEHLGKANDRIAELEKRCANYEMTISKMEKGTCDICKEIEKDKKIEELEAQIEKMKKYGKLLQDICTVMGNDPYMVSVGLENRVKVLWDTSEEKDGLKMVEDIENRLLKIKPQEWAEITKWEIKEK